MKILCIDDDFFKRNQIGEFLERKGIQLEEIEFVNPALKYICTNKESISGIILDLGLKSFKDSNDYNIYKGLDVIAELERKKIKIPILINSTTEIDFQKDDHPYVFGHRKRKNDYKILEEFLAFLKEREEQQ